MFTACGGAGRQVSTAPSSPITTITAPVVISASGGNVVHSVTISVVYTK
jgi:hypothetical protein